jgi:hypothetical protein|tara:strand:+ start:205 stop:486 length:282 start_codon:yes stop_codon:yes gene_type:complete
MKSFKEFIGTTGVRIGNYSNHQPIASLGDTPPKKRAGGKNVRGVGLHAAYTGAVNQRPMVSADPKKGKKENTMGGMVHVRGAQPTASIKTKRK